MRVLVRGVDIDIKQLGGVLATVPDLELAILIGSHATGTAHPDSDWDIAIQWARSLSFLEQLSAAEKLRKKLSEVLGRTEQAIDLIDLPTARLAMRAVVAEEGLPLKGGDTLAWNHFLQKTWRQLEEHYWEKIYAA